MASLRCRVGLWNAPRYKAKPIIASLGRLRLVKEPAGRYSVMHAPTGLGLHMRLQDLPLHVARRALVLARQLDEWDWSDPNEVYARPFSDTRPLWEALATIAEMAEAR